MLKENGLYPLRRNGHPCSSYYVPGFGFIPKDECWALQLANAAGVDVCPGGNAEVRTMFSLGPTDYPTMNQVAEFVDRTSPLALIQCMHRPCRRIDPATLEDIAPLAQKVVKQGLSKGKQLAKDVAGKAVQAGLEKLGVPESAMGTATALAGEAFDRLGDAAERTPPDDTDAQDPTGDDPDTYRQLDAWDRQTKSDLVNEARVFEDDLARMRRDVATRDDRACARRDAQVYNA
eukprot:COSAG02_NODE_17560_length_995_cov_0.897321_2_plen_232_part_01